MKFGGQPTPWSDEQIDGLRCRAVAQMLIEEIGADGPESAEDAAKRAVTVIQHLRQRIAALEAEKAEREAQEPVAYVTDEPSPNPEPIAWLAGKRAGMKLYAEPPIPRELEARIRELEAEKAEREGPVAWAWDDALGCMHVHCGSRRPVWVDGECSDAKRAETSLRPLYAAPPIPRVEQEPVAWVLFDDIFIASKDMQDDPPNLECMKPLYAAPLAKVKAKEE